jgi:hypothetical protein
MRWLPKALPSVRFLLAAVAANGYHMARFLLVQSLGSWRTEVCWGSGIRWTLPWTERWMERAALGYVVLLKTSLSALGCLAGDYMLGSWSFLQI